MREFRYILRPKPGSILETGEIVTASFGLYGYSIARYGAIRIDSRRLHIAERFGWRPTGDRAAGMVVVSRP